MFIVVHSKDFPSDGRYHQVDGTEISTAVCVNGIRYNLPVIQCREQLEEQW